MRGRVTSLGSSKYAGQLSDLADENICWVPLQESYLYEGIKLWAMTQERAFAAENETMADFMDMLLSMVSEIRFRLCSPGEMVEIFGDPWLVEVFHKPFISHIVSLTQSSTVMCSQLHPKDT